jgi:hypothetical protein
MSGNPYSSTYRNCFDCKIAFFYILKGQILKGNHSFMGKSQAHVMPFESKQWQIEGINNALAEQVVYT